MSSYAQRDRTTGMFSAQSAVGGSANADFYPSSAEKDSSESFNFLQVNLPLLAAVCLVSFITLGIVFQKKFTRTADLSRSTNVSQQSDFSNQDYFNRDSSSLLALNANSGWDNYERDYDSSYNREYQESFSREASNLDSRVYKLEKQLKEHQHKVWKLAMANNENAAIRKRIDSKYHPYQNSNYMVFDKDWSVNKWPETLSLTDNQRALLRGDVKVKSNSVSRPISSRPVYTYPSNNGAIIYGNGCNTTSSNRIIYDNGCNTSGGIIYNYCR